MDYSKLTLLVISGPNGAGKSTHISSMLPKELKNCLPFDRDKTRVNFESQLNNGEKSTEYIKGMAEKMMENLLIQKMDEAIKEEKHFVLETPLSHPDYWRYLDKFEKAKYQIQLNYLCLDGVENCISRVQQRVKEGGHSVDGRTVKGVYEMNLKYIDDYRATFKQINLYDGTVVPVLLAQLEDNKVVEAYDVCLQKSWVNKGMPSISKEINNYIVSNTTSLSSKRNKKVFKSKK